MAKNYSGDIEEWENDLPYQVRRRSDSGSYALRFSIKGFGQQRFGLGTTDKHEAYTKAQMIYAQTLAAAEAGTLGGKKSFKHFAKEYSKLLFEEAENNSTKIAEATARDNWIKRYFIPALGEKSINTITVAHLNDYVRWRKNYWTTGAGKDVEWITYLRGKKKVSRKPVRKEPSHATLVRELHVLRSIFKHAADYGFIKPSDIPSPRLKSQTPNRRPYFTKKDIKKLIKVGLQRVIDSPDFQTHFERQMLVNYIAIAVRTGLRPGELHSLRWGNIEGIDEILDSSLAEKAIIKITAHGKGKGPQQMIPMQSVASHLISLQDQFHQIHKRGPNKHDPVFCNFNGEPLKSIRKGLVTLLEAADLRTDVNGRNYSAYCFRHTYATWARQKSPPVDVYTLAINMRTSVRMIEDYYGHAQSADQVEILGEDDLW